MFHRSTIRSLFVAVLGSILIPATARAAHPCPADLDCSGSVNIDDLTAVILGWGSCNPSPCAGDTNGDNQVNIDDLTSVILSWGQCTFQYQADFPNAEAEQIGLEFLGSTGPLLLPQSTYDRIVRDLSLIRAAYPDLADQTHTPAWAPNQLIVSVTQSLSHENYQCLKTYYQVTDESLLFSFGGTDYYVITFAGHVNVVRLASIFAEAPEISSADPNSLVGGENFWVPSLLISGSWRWSIDDGFFDCFDGCDCHKQYVIDIDTPGNVTLVDYQQFGQPWCDFGGGK
ncbi:MAG TPA: hypothetical protein VG711_05735 [Phycisphaerales bacterium]|nr:hypothetical protein [Phycisphaerales bacterium]